MSEYSFDHEEDFGIEELSEAEEVLLDLEAQFSIQDTVQESKSCKAAAEVAAHRKQLTWLTLIIIRFLRLRQIAHQHWIILSIVHDLC